MTLTAACSGDAVRDRSRERRVDVHRASEFAARIRGNYLDVLARLGRLDHLAVAAPLRCLNVA